MMPKIIKQDLIFIEFHHLFFFYENEMKNGDDDAAAKMFEM